MSKRMYIAEHAGQTRVVSAANKNVAIAHIAKDMVKVRVAKANDMPALVRAGIAIEEAQPIKEPTEK